MKNQVLYKGSDNIGKIIVLTFTDTEENTVEKIISVLANEMQFEAVKPALSPILSFPGLEIRLHQRRVLRNGTDINLTRLEYGTLAYLASSPRRVFTQEQIFEAVWHMDSNSCHSSVVNVIYSLRKKIEPDSKNPTYIKTVLGVGYKFDVKSTRE